MTLRQTIKAKIKELKSQCQYKQKPALVEVNAPLALIQVELTAKVAALEWVLREMKSCS